MAKTGIDSAIGIVVLLAAVMIGGLIFVQIGASIPATAIGQQVTGEGITINTTEVTLIPDVFSYQTATSAIVGAQAKVYNATTTFVAGTDYNLVLSNGTLTILTGGALLYNTSQTIDVDVLTYQTANYPIVAGTPKIYNATTTFVAGTDYNLVLSNGTLTILTGGALRARQSLSRISMKGEAHGTTSRP